MPTGGCFRYSKASEIQWWRHRKRDSRYTSIESKDIARRELTIRCNPTSSIFRQMSWMSKLFTCRRVFNCYTKRWGGDEGACSKQMPMTSICRQNDSRSMKRETFPIHVHLSLFYFLLFGCLCHVAPYKKLSFCSHAIIFTIHAKALSQHTPPQAISALFSFNCCLHFNPLDIFFVLAQIFMWVAKKEAKNDKEW